MFHYIVLKYRGHSIDEAFFDISSSDPGTAPIRKSSFQCFPGKIKYGAILLPTAFPPAIIVMVDPPGDVTHCGFVPLLQTIFGGLCS